MKEHVLIMPDGKVELFTRPKKTKEFRERFSNAKESGKFHILEIQKYKWVSKLHSSELGVQK